MAAMKTTFLLITHLRPPDVDRGRLRGHASVRGHRGVRQPRRHARSASTTPSAARSASRSAARRASSASPASPASARASSASRPPSSARTGAGSRRGRALRRRRPPRRRRRRRRRRRPRQRRPRRRRLSLSGTTPSSGALARSCPRRAGAGSGGAGSVPADPPPVRAGSLPAGCDMPASPRWTIRTAIAAIVAARTTWSHRLTTSVPAPITWTAASAQAIGMKRCALRQRRAPSRRRA